jgi:hypothetical protein
LQSACAWPVIPKLHKPRADAISSRDLFWSNMDPETFGRPDDFCLAFPVLALCLI